MINEVSRISTYQFFNSFWLQIKDSTNVKNELVLFFAAARMDQIVAEFADLEKVGRSVKLIGSEQPL